MTAKATPDDVIKEYEKWKGYKESPSGSNNTKAGAWYGMNGEPWCAMQNSYVFFLAGAELDITTHKGYSYCPSGVEWAKEHGVWHPRTAHPRKAWLTFYNFSGGTLAEHTGCVADDVDDSSSAVHAWEGNTIPDGSSGSQANGGEVCYKLRPRWEILGFADVSQFMAREPKPHKPSWAEDNGDYGHPQLTYQAHGEPVKHLQYRLIAQRHNVVVDGIFGGSTLAAVKAFQKYEHLTVDGVVGSKTWAALHR